LSELNKTIIKSLLPLFVCFFISKPALATFSIIACEDTTKTCAAAVATNNLAVGASVIYAEGGVGALVTQFETNPNYGPKGLELLRRGESTKKVLELLLEGDNNFDGGGIEDRQVALIDLNGLSAQYDGANALDSDWAGSVKGPYYSMQGNGLGSENVLIAMQRVFVESRGTLAERVMVALREGQRAGGQKTGSMSAALVSRTLEGFPHDIDIRVDASKEPVKALQRLLNFHYARQLIIGAERVGRQGQFKQSLPLITQALERGATWDRIWRRAARLAIKFNEKERAIEYLKVFRTLNPVWFEIEAKQPIYKPLHKLPQFILLTSSSWHSGRSIETKGTDKQ
jgi:uncharacterized Ntn-hydrolase superfamily protein